MSKVIVTQKNGFDYNDELKGSKNDIICAKYGMTLQMSNYIMELKLRVDYPLSKTQRKNMVKQDKDYGLMGAKVVLRIV